MKRIRSALVAAAVAAGLAGCTAQAPYIRAPELIDREHPDFAKERTDRRGFTVCYAKWNTDPAAVRDLAVGECGLYRKRAVFLDTTYQVCPLAAPAGARYVCVGEGERVADVLAAERRRLARPSEAEFEDEYREGVGSPTTPPEMIPETGPFQ